MPRGPEAVEFLKQFSRFPAGKSFAYSGGMTAALSMNLAPDSLPSMAVASHHASDSGLSFHDLLNIVNPLQHIPIVSTLYRAATGDTIAPLERIAGDTLYGGAWGFVASVANVAFQEVTGKDIGDTVLGWIEGDDNGDATADTANPMATSPVRDGTPISYSDAIAAVSDIGPSAISAPPVATTPAANAPPMPLQSSNSQAPATTSDAAMQALMKAMSDKGIDPTLSQRALSAYGKSVAPPATLVPTS